MSVTTGETVMRLVLCVVCFIAVVAALAITSLRPPPAVAAGKATLGPSWLPRESKQSVSVASIWGWPAEEKFDETWQQRKNERRLARIAWGDLKILPPDGASSTWTPPDGAPAWIAGIPLTVARRERRVELAVFSGVSGTMVSNAWAVLGPSAAWNIESGELARGTTLVLVGSDRKIELKISELSQAASPAEAAFADWTYVETLLGAQGSAYDPEAVGDQTWEDEPNPADLSQLRKVLAEHRGALRSRGWFDAAESLAKTDASLALEIFRRYQPLGRCSMDRHPAEAARAYAELCFQEKRLGCFLQLQVQIMADRFSRVAWSNYGEAAAATEAERLESAGVDVDRFLRGLLFSFVSPREGAFDIGPQRLARSIKELSRDKHWLTELARHASDETLDEHNRTRAAQTLYFLAEYDEQGAGRSALSAVKLTTAAERWLAADDD